MAVATYPDGVRHLFMHEGGYTNDPRDPGGPTNFGITLKDYRLYINPRGQAEDVRNMTVAQARAIYKSKYWDAMRCDSLPAGVDYVMFDYGVNSGIGRAGKVLRRLLGLPDNTGVVTDAVIAATLKRDPAELVRAIDAERLAFLKHLKTWPVFGKGWGRRVAEVDAYALKLAAGNNVIPFPVPAPAPGKGHIPQPKVDPKVAIPTGTGAAAAGASFGWVGIVVLALAIVAAVGTFLYLKKRRDRRQTAPVPGVPIVVVPERKAA